MNLFVVRHGQTNWNLEGRLQGRTDIKLNKTGILQAEVVRDKLSNEQIDLIICSPLLRTRKTADVINKDRAIPIIIDERIIERSCGPFEGQIINDFDWENFISYSKNHKYEKAESMHEFYNRVTFFIDEISKKYSDKNILLVTHGGVSLPIYCYFNSIPEDKRLSEHILDNCEIAKYTI